MQTKRFLSRALIATLCLGSGWLAQAEIKGDIVSGKKIFVMEDADGNSCNKCHPKGKTNNKTIRGKKVPNLTERVAKISDRRLLDKARKHLDRDTKLELTDEQFNDLIAFVRSLPEKGFGSEPGDSAGK